MPNVSAEESLLLQCLATTSLLGELSNAKFLESDYYKRWKCQEMCSREIPKI